MFADSLSVTISAVAKTLPRVAFGDRKGSFESAADGLTFDIAHTTTGKGRRRSSARLVHTSIAADPLLTGVNRQRSSTFQFVMDAPLAGYTVAEKEELVEALADWLKVQSNRDKLINGEA